MASNKFSENLRMRWLRLQSYRLRLNYQLSGLMKSWIKSTYARLAVGVAVFIPILALLSDLSTLSGYSVPALLKEFQSQRPPAEASPSTANGSTKSAQTPPTSPNESLAVDVEMPIISGRYTFCPTTPGQSSPRLLNFLYDVHANAGKVAFFDVRLDIDCILGGQPDYEAAFNRLGEAGSVSYFFRVPLVNIDAPVTSPQLIDGTRNLAILRDMYSDNGSVIAVSNSNDSRNPLSSFQPHVEGSTDILFGPYTIKESYDDAIITFDLSAAFLDTTALQKATAIKKRLHSARSMQAASSSAPVGRSGP